MTHEMLNAQPQSSTHDSFIADHEGTAQLSVNRRKLKFSEQASIEV